MFQALRGFLNKANLQHSVINTLDLSPERFCSLSHTPDSTL